MKTFRPVALVLISWMAGDHAVADWVREPETVLGFNIGAPFDAAQFPACAPGTKQACLIQVDSIPGRFVFRNAPDLGFWYEASLDVQKGRLMKISFMIDSSSFDRALAVLVERYGPATSARENEFITMAGGHLPSREAAWTGKRVQLTMVERHVRADAGRIIFVSVPMLQEEQREQKARDMGAAQKL